MGFYIHIKLPQFCFSSDQWNTSVCAKYMESFPYILMIVLIAWKLYGWDNYDACVEPLQIKSCAVCTCGPKQTLLCTEWEVKSRLCMIVWKGAATQQRRLQVGLLFLQQEILLLDSSRSLSFWALLFSMLIRPFSASVSVHQARCVNLNTSLFLLLSSQHIPLSSCSSRHCVVLFLLPDFQLELPYLWLWGSRTKYLHDVCAATSWIRTAENSALQEDLHPLVFLYFHFV